MLHIDVHALAVHGSSSVQQWIQKVTTTILQYQTWLSFRILKGQIMTHIGDQMIYWQLVPCGVISKCLRSLPLQPNIATWFLSDKLLEWYDKYYKVKICQRLDWVCSDFFICWMLKTNFGVNLVPLMGIEQWHVVTFAFTSSSHYFQGFVHSLSVSRTVLSFLCIPFPLVWSMMHSLGRVGTTLPLLGCIESSCYMVCQVGNCGCSCIWLFLCCFSFIAGIYCESECGSDGWIVCKPNYCIC